MLKIRFVAACALAIGLLVPATAAHAQFQDIARGLYLLGFYPQVSQNPLTKGYDATYYRSFSDSTLKYGVSTLTLTGGLTLDGSIAKCPFPSASFGIRSVSDPTGNLAAQPLSYTLTIPRPLEPITVTGTVTIDTNATVDKTGFYSTTLSVSNRGTITTGGVVGSSNNINFDTGPVSQTGNIYLKAAGGLINLVAGDETGAPIANLPSSGPLVSLDQYQLASADPSTLNLDDPQQLEAYVNAVVLQGISQAAVDPSIGKTTPAASTPVPEPSTLLLLALSGAMTCLTIRRRLAR